jgi:hypothetical protein
VAGEVVKCPKCGRMGRLARHVVRAKGRTYVYTAVKHVENGRVKRCILGRFEEGRGAEEGRAPARADLGSYEDALEILSSRYQRARELAASGDFSELEKFVAFVERKLSPAIARWHEEAKALLQGYGELAA